MGDIALLTYKAIVIIYTYLFCRVMILFGSPPENLPSHMSDQHWIFRQTISDVNYLIIYPFPIFLLLSSSKKVELRIPSLFILLLHMYILNGY